MPKSERLKDRDGSLKGLLETGKKHFNKGKYSIASIYFDRLAAHEDPEAIFYRAYIYQMHSKSRGHLEIAKVMFKKASDKGFLEATYCLGRIYVAENSLESVEKAEALFDIGVSKGHIECMKQRAKLYIFEHGSESCIGKALALYEKAYRAGSKSVLCFIKSINEAMRLKSSTYIACDILWTDLLENLSLTTFTKQLLIDNCQEYIYKKILEAYENNELSREKLMDICERDHLVADILRGKPATGSGPSYYQRLLGLKEGIIITERRTAFRRLRLYSPGPVPLERRSSSEFSFSSLSDLTGENHSDENADKESPTKQMFVRDIHTQREDSHVKTESFCVVM